MPQSRLTILAVAVLAASLATPGRADDDDCAVPMAQWQPRAAILALAETQGWKLRRIKIEDGCYAVYARDAAGRKVEIMLDPATLEILEIEREDDDDGEDRDTDRNRDHD